MFECGSWLQVGGDVQTTWACNRISALQAPPLDMDTAAAYLGITSNTLRAYRFKRYPPGHPRAFPEPLLRVGNGKVPLWSREQLDAWRAS